MASHHDRDRDHHHSHDHDHHHDGSSWVGDDGKVYHSHDGLAPHSHEPIYHPGHFPSRAPLIPTRNFADRAFTIGIGGPVGTGVPLDGIHPQIQKQPIDAKAMHRMKAKGMRDPVSSSIPNQMDFVQRMDEVQITQSDHMGWMRAFRRNVRDTLREDRTFNQNLFKMLRSLHPSDRVIKSFNEQSVFGSTTQGWLDKQLSDSDEAEPPTSSKAKKDRQKKADLRAHTSSQPMAEEEEEMDTGSETGEEDYEEGMKSSDDGDDASGEGSGEANE